MESDADLLKILRKLQETEKEDIVHEERERRQATRKSRVETDLEAMDTDDVGVCFKFHRYNTNFVFFVGSFRLKCSIAVAPHSLYFQRMEVFSAVVSFSFTRFAFFAVSLFCFAPFSSLHPDSPSLQKYGLHQLFILSWTPRSYIGNTVRTPSLTILISQWETEAYLPYGLFSIFILLITLSPLSSL